jgi:glycosyltransferase involved in cell wall biosynthesis
MPKLLLLIPTLDHSGAEKQFALLATRLPRDEFDVHAVTLTRGGPYEAMLQGAGVRLTHLNKRMKFDPLALWRLRSLVKEERPDILHAWIFAANSYARLVAGKEARPKVLVSERCVDSWKSDWQLWLDRRQIGRTTRLIGNSQSVAEFYRELGVPADKLAVIPNAVEIPADPQADRDRILAEFDIPPGSRVVGFAGRLAPQKRVKDLVWAIQLLKQLRDRVYLLLVGDGPERTHLLELARHMSCDHLVRFTGHRDDAARLIGLFNVFWLASDFEGMSNSIMEAMAAGVPVVASDIPPNRELVVDGQTGFLVKVGDSVGLAQFADRILADPALAERLGTAGRERMRTKFSVEQMVARHVELYRQVLASPASPRPNELPASPNEPPALRRRSSNDASSAEQTAGVKPAARQAPSGSEGDARCAE